MICTVTFSLDHFGVVASPLVAQLLNQSSNKRARKSAFNSLVRMAKATKQIASSEKVLGIGLVTDEAGQLTLNFSTEVVLHESR